MFLEQKQDHTLLKTDQEQRKERLKKALDNAVTLGVFAGIDGVAWQNEQRKANKSEQKQYEGFRDAR